MQSEATAKQALPPEAVVMQMVMGGWVARAISEVCRLNIPDAVKANGPMTAAQLNNRGLGVNSAALERVLRACASVGIFTEDSDGRFGPTPLSEVLTASAPDSVKVVATEISGTWLRMLSELGEAIRTGEPQAKRIFGMEWWDWLNANPKELEVFGEAMKSNSQNSLRGVLEKCDFGNTKKIADIGGGFGHLVIALLEKYPHLNGIVVDLPELIPLARDKNPPSEGVAGRLEYVGGNMFDSVPPADAYIMKHIIHDWDDEHCVRLLKNCHRGMQGSARLICVDSVLPPMGDASGSSAKFLDLLMMNGIRGKERTKKEWVGLYEAAGFRVTSIVPLQDNFGTSIVEGVRA
jgi:hypothetical protein